MSETTGGGWIAGRVYVGEVSADGNQITFHGSPPMAYTEQLRQGVRGSFRINGGYWNQRRLANRFIAQNPDVADPAQLLANAFALQPIISPPTAPAGPMVNEFEQEGQLEIAQVLLDLQTYRGLREAEAGLSDDEEVKKQKRGGKRTKRRRPKRKSKRK